MTVQPLPNDDGWQALWGLDQIDQRKRPLDNRYAYDYTGRGVTVYVVDSGLNPNHRELRGRVAQGHSVLNDDPSTTDCTGHGTGIASVIAGATLGVAKGVTIVPVRIFGCSHLTSTTNIQAGIQWMIDHHQPGQLAVANFSFGSDRGDEVIDKAVNEALLDGIHVVLAAGGKTGGDACSVSPGRITDAILVGAVDRDLKKIPSSNFGSCVDIWAPGGQIVNARHDSNVLRTSSTSTSIAAPFVTGAVSLLLEEFGQLTTAAVTKTIMKNATKGVLKGIGPDSPNLLLYIGRKDRRFAPKGSATCGSSSRRGVAETILTCTR